MKAEGRNEAHTYSYSNLFVYFLSVIQIFRHHHLLCIHREELMGKISNLIFLARFNLICQNLSPFNVSSSLGRCFTGFCAHEINLVLRQ